MPPMPSRRLHTFHRFSSLPVHVLAFPVSFQISLDSPGDSDSFAVDGVLSPWLEGPPPSPGASSLGAPSNRLAAIVPHAASCLTTDGPDVSLSPPPQPVRAHKKRRKGLLERPVAFASRMGGSEFDEEDLDNAGVGIHSRSLPLVSCSAARAIICIGGMAAIGAVGLRLTRDFLRKRRRARLGGPGPPSAFARLLGSVLLANPPTKKKDSGILSRLTGGSLQEAATSEALGETGSVTALYFTGRSVEQILESKGYVPFTPRLKAIVEASAQRGHKLNVVFVSADNHASDAAKLFKTMPWYAVPFDESEGRERIRSLYKRFRVTSLPHVVLLDANGRVTNPQAYTSMLANPQDFPWNRKNPLQLLGDRFVTPKGDTVDASALKGKTVGIYFSASWCPPCQRFTARLVETVKKLRERGEQVELVLVSNDRDAESFKNYFAKMDWLAVPFTDAATRAVAQDTLGVRSLPTLIWVDSSGEVLTRRGVASVSNDPEGALFPWKDKAVKDVDEALESIAEEPVLLAFMDQATEKTQQQVQKAMEEAAEALKQEAAGETLPPVPQFLTAKRGSPRTAALRQICKEGLPAEDAEGQVSLSLLCAQLILDVFSQKVYVYPKGTEPLTKESLLDFVGQYRNELLEGRPLTLPD
ncbi:hypothetical protein ACSSS7_001498 [Eimeria intestinalis]